MKFMDEIVEHVHDSFKGNSILFVGAGFSLSAKNISDSPIMGVGQLTQKLYDAANIDSDSDLGNAVDEFLLQHSENELITLLKKEYSVKEISREQKIITSIPWKRVYTTNYDDVIEMGYRANSKLATTVTLSDKMKDSKSKFNLCIHLNGFIGNLTADKIKSEFKLSDISYLGEDFLQSEWVTLFRSDIHDSDTIVFIGFSLRYDLDLKRILYAFPESIKKVIFILREGEIETTLRAVRKFGKVFTIGLSNFANIIEDEKKSYVPIIKTEYKYKSFIEVKVKSTVEKIHDKDVFDMFFEGYFTDQFIYQSIFETSKQKYIVRREATDLVIDKINSGFRRLLIHSDLGNGKTIFIQGLAVVLQSQGYNVFLYNRFNDDIKLEIEKIAALPKPVIILESYNNNYKILKDILLHANDDLTIVLTERTFINDTVYSRLFEDGFTNYYTVDLNFLSESEIVDFIELLDNYGFWGEYSSFTNEKKVNFIKGSVCNKQIRLILLAILNSSDIKERFSKILNVIITKKAFYNAVLLILASNVFDFRFDFDQLVYILDDEILHNPTFVNNPSLKEIIDFDNNEIKVRSAILSEAILTNIEDQQILIDCLVKLIKKVNIRIYDSKMKQIFRAVISFSRLQRILNKKAKNYKETLISFFEEIKNLNSTRRDPYFWLQYAIASLSFKDYELADTYFKNAYSYASNKGGFDTFQIDNHYARHILESEIHNGEVASCMQQFLKAHEILTRKSNNDGRHYPIRVANNYYVFYQKFFAEMGAPDKNVFLKSCQEILYKIEDYKKVNDKIFQKDVVECEQSLNKIILKEFKFIKKT